MQKATGIRRGRICPVANDKNSDNFLQRVAHTTHTHSEVSLRLGACLTRRCSQETAGSNYLSFCTKRKIRNPNYRNVAYSI